MQTFSQLSITKKQEMLYSILEQFSENPEFRNLRKWIKDLDLNDNSALLENIFTTIYDTIDQSNTEVLDEMQQKAVYDQLQNIKKEFANLTISASSHE